ncbi:MAG: hypothetical protein A3J94_10570 [Syntrophus sp. RIFOXYC2_FULL_54_9]|nr:MAG: hypothetical protein A3J94_10570 [Syntrophus sp. RIFOXYC2_FULL_54_9]
MAGRVESNGPPGACLDAIPTAVASFLFEYDETIFSWEYCPNRAGGNAGRGLALLTDTYLKGKPRLRFTRK